jgi:hypothetical protein
VSLLGRLGGGWDEVIFARANTERPSSERKKGAGELLREAGLEFAGGEGGEASWQETLGKVWAGLHGEDGGGVTVAGSVKEALERVQGGGAIVFCTGSLYIVGSLLEELGVVS